MSTQDRSTSYDTSSDILSPNHSSDGCTLIQHMAQSQRHLAQEAPTRWKTVAFRFLASFVGSPWWRDTISFANSHNPTLAHLAVLFWYTALLDKLVEWGVNLDVQDLNGFTAPHCAYLCKEWGCVRLLRSAGADEDLEDILGRRPVDVHSPRTGYIRASTPSSDGASSPARLPNEDGDWENITRDTSQISSLEASEVVKDPQSSRAHTSDYHSTGKPLIVSLALPSSADPNDSWIKAFGEKVQIPDFPIDRTPPPSRQVAQLSRLGQYATPYPPTTSVPTGPFRPHGSTREPPAAYYPSPGTPTSDFRPDIQPTTLRDWPIVPEGNEPSRGERHRPIFRLSSFSLYLSNVPKLPFICPGQTTILLCTVPILRHHIIIICYITGPRPRPNDRIDRRQARLAQVRNTTHHHIPHHRGIVSEAQRHTLMRNPREAQLMKGRY